MEFVGCADEGRDQRQERDYKDDPRNTGFIR